MANSRKSDSSVVSFLEKLFEPRTTSALKEGQSSQVKQEVTEGEEVNAEDDGWTTESSSSGDDDEQPDDESDKVICEIPVFFSKRLNNQLFALKYQTSGRWVDNHKVQNFAVRPKQQQLLVDMALDTSDKHHYDKQKASDIAARVDGDMTNRKENATFPSGSVDKVAFKSKECLRDSNYCAGVFMDGELHLSPVAGVFDMRPDFSHLDQADELHKKVAAAAAAEQESAGSSEDSKEPKLTAVNVRISKVRGKSLREKHIQHQNRLNEPWMQLQYNDIQSEQSLESWNKLFCSGNPSGSKAEGSSHVNGEAMEVDEIQSDVKPISREEYIKLLLPDTWQEGENSTASSQGKVKGFVSFSQLKAAPLAEQISELMRKASVLRFQMLMQNLPARTDPETVLSHLEEVAVLVAGCWAIRSELVYVAGEPNLPTGSTCEQLRDGRDLVLWRFTLGKCVKRKDISAAVKLPHDHVLHILEPIARPPGPGDAGWRLGVEPDPHFLQHECPPGVRLRQQLLWQHRYHELCGKHKMCRQGQDTPLVTAGRERQHSGESRGGARARKRSTSASSPAVDAAPTPLTELQEELDTYVTAYTSGRHVLSVRGLTQELVTSVRAKCGDAHPLVLGTSDLLLRHVLPRWRYLRMDGKWRDGRLNDTYALGTTGDADLDLYIGPMLAAFRDNPVMKLSELKSLLSRHLLHLPGDSVIQHILHMYCNANKTVLTFKFFVP